jgi:hypothetical protein
MLRYRHSVLIFISLFIFSFHNILAQQIRINEVMTSNFSTISDEDGSFEDWIELYNYGSEAINLYGYGLSDNPEIPFKWTLPEYEIQPDEYLLIWASGKNREPVFGNMTYGIKRLFYAGIPGVSVNDLINHANFPNHPTSANVINTFFEAPKDIADNYGQHMYTWLSPPLTGEYTFWISSDDNSRLFLSTNDNPENAKLIAQVPEWTNSRQWNKYPQQMSGRVYLEKDKLYYLSALMKEGQGGDNLAVQWRFPDGTIQSPISAKHCLIPEGKLHTNFRLNSSGEELILTHPEGRRIDQMPATYIPTDVSYGRKGTSSNWYFFQNATPGKANSTQGYELITPKPHISPSAGIYNTPVEVSITSDEENVIIYYTTNGTPPGPHNGIIYTGPFSLIHTRYVRAVAVAEGMMASEIAGTSFSVTHSSVEDFSSNLPLMIINQFGEPITDFKESIAYMQMIENQAGRNQISDDPIFSGRIKINIRGSSSNYYFPKKGYRFHIINEDESNRKESLLGMPEEHNWVLHGPYSDKSLMRNAVSYALAGDMGHYAPRTRFVELFLNTGTGTLHNNHYHGVYLLVERIKIAPGRVDIKELEQHHNQYPEVSGGYIFKKDRYDPGEIGIRTARGSDYALVRPNENTITEAQKQYLISYLDSLEIALFGANFKDPDKGYNAFIDVRSFIDYHLITELCKEIDGYRLSTFFHKDREGRLVLGPVWDFNLSLGNANYAAGWNPIGWYYPLIDSYQYLNGWYTRLFQDERFMQQYRHRYRRLRSGVFSNDHILGMVDNYHDLLKESQARNFQRWDILGKYVWPNWFIARTHTEEVIWMKNWIRNRLAWMDTQLGKPYTLIHYWNFNSEQYKDPTYTKHEASFDFIPGAQSEITTGTGQNFIAENARYGDEAGMHLRINNPVGSELIFKIPSTNYKDISFSYETRRSSNGSNRQHIYYTIDGINFILRESIDVTESPILQSFDLSDITLANHNPDFGIKIRFDFKDDGNGGRSGNNRIDNITVEGEFSTPTNAVEIVDNEELLLFPNPVTNGSLHINKKISGKIYNISGTITGTINEENHLDVSSYSSGLYLLKTDHGITLRFMVVN